jgi:hypothetical protein
MNLKRSLAVLSAAALVAFPAGAMAKNGTDGGHGKGGKAAEAKAEHKKPKKPKTSTYQFRGLVTAVGDGTLQVDVKSGNSRGMKFKGQALTFDVTKAKFHVADVDKDGRRDMADVAVGDRVQVQAKLPRGAVDTTRALPARHVLDKGPVRAPEPESTPEVAPPAPAS